MNMPWKTILIQFAVWVAALYVLVWLVSKIARRITKVRLRFRAVANILALLLLLAFLLALIFNIRFGGPGPDGGGGGGQPGANSGHGPAGADATPLASVVLRIEQSTPGNLDLWLEPQNLQRQGPMQVNGSPEFRRALGAALDRVQEELDAQGPIHVKIVLPAALETDVARNVLEDMLRSHGLAVAGVDF
jgi:hypothetical protein